MAPKFRAVAVGFRAGREVSKTWNYEVPADIVRDWLAKRDLAAATVHYTTNENRTNWEIHVRANPSQS